MKSIIFFSNRHILTTCLKMNCYSLVVELINKEGCELFSHYQTLFKPGDSTEVKVTTTASNFWKGHYKATGYWGGSTKEKSDTTSVFLLSSKAYNYPSYIDPKSGKVMTEPSASNWSVTPYSQRVVWTTTARDNYKQWYERNWGIPAGGWSGYEVHHIQPLKFGGTNDYSNLIPLPSSFHRQVVTPWWRGY